MFTISPEIPPVDTSVVGTSVYAHLDDQTLAAIDRRCDDQNVPRSWMIARILQDWAAAQQHEQDQQNLAA